MNGLGGMKRERTLQLNQLYRWGASIIVAVLIILLFTGTVLYVQASKDDAQKVYCYYTSVSVHEGDTIWDLAAPYYDQEHCGTYQEYIAQIKRTNGLGKDTIYAGAHITIPYYSTEEIRSTCGGM